MLQIILFLAGLTTLIKGKIKVSSDKEIVRPHSIYLGIIFIICAIAISLIQLGLFYDLAFFIFPIILVIGFAMKGKRIHTPEAVKEKKETKRNLIILLIFIAIIVTIFYFSFK